MRPVADLAERWEWFGDRLSDFIIDRSVKATRNRPHPWSTLSDYTSWQSLSDRSWSARHLPAYPETAPLPDIEKVVNLFRRSRPQRKSAKSTCLFPAFAQYLTDGFIRTIPDDSDFPPEMRRRGTTSNHEIDLCPLYGRTVAQTRILRTLSGEPGERGRLKSQRIDGEEYAPFLFEADGVNIAPEFIGLDPPLGLRSIADDGRKRRLFAFGGDRANAVPHVAAINTLLLREHNRVAGLLEQEYPGWDDERLFQTARNIVIVLFIKIVVEDYINHIAPVPVRLRANPRVAWKASWNRPNWITAEFSLLYRWHSLIPDEMSWGGTSHPVGSLFMDNRPLLQVGMGRAFAELSTQPTGQLGPLNTTQALIPMEEFAIRQGRINRLAPYSHYLTLLGLDAPTRFEDVSSDPEVVRVLRDVYGSVDRIEFYPGLFAEDTVPNSPLPNLILRMVAVDAFSQALTNPLLSQHVFGDHGRETFTPLGLILIEQTHRLEDVVSRNVPAGTQPGWIGMTQQSWKHEW
ncbi:MAG: heme peroxidase [Rhodospirillales bacterium]|nr:heme peroxidase [Rhodospirillales bacterium]